MALKRRRGDPGTLVVLEHVSRVLRDNPLGDPHVRKLAVWLPPQYDDGTQRRFPVLFEFAGFTSSGLARANWRPFAENVPERLARLLHEGRIGPTIVVFPDCFTALGGNQYLNSPALGRYADYLTRELVPFVDREFRTLAAREHRGCYGRSSGGYGALLHGMRHADTWGAIASHSGDAYFEFVYGHDWPATLTELARFRAPPRRPGPYAAQVHAHRAGLAQGLDDGRVRRFLQHVWRKEKLSAREALVLMQLCMAATYDPDPKAPCGFRLPFHLETGERIEARWRRWRAHDPIHLVARYRHNLKRLRGIFIDCGWRDQFHIHYGNRILSLRLAAARIRHTYEEFDDDHSDIEYRLERSLPFLYRALRA
ncbi:MAG: alpha/beta hydrolase-fold protein [Burkholderiaceae bacterium]|nr:alpha/beta hydrolase-fold protein [Burkholderiaceae bacterium]MCX8004356.1 alpha/beta hydrolase-fold protein [Burkholderiaceae bacterium]